MDVLICSKCARIYNVLIISFIIIVNVCDSSQQKLCKENISIVNKTCFVNVINNNSYIVNIWMLPQVSFEKVVLADLRLQNKTFLTLNENWFSIGSWKNIFMNIALTQVKNGTGCSATYILANESTEIQPLPLPDDNCFHPKEIYLVFYGKAKVRFTEPLPTEDEHEPPENYILGLRYIYFYIIVSSVTSVPIVILVCSLVIFTLHRRKVRKLNADSRIQLATNEVISCDRLHLAERVKGNSNKNCSTEEDDYCDVDLNCIDDNGYCDVDPKVSFGPVLIGGRHKVAYENMDEFCEYSEVDANIAEEPGLHIKHQRNENEYVDMDPKSTLSISDNTCEYSDVDYNL